MATAEALLADPARRNALREALLALKADRKAKREAEQSLHEFVRQMWKYVDPAPFKDNWHLEEICEHLEAVSRGEIQRLIINIPPRHSKSTIVAVMWPAWTWIHQRSENTPLMGANVQFLTASYAQALSTRDSVKSRRLIDSPVYQQRWGHGFEMTSDQNTKMRYENSVGGYRIATSVGGAVTGEGGDVIIVDDPINVTESESALTREAATDWWDKSMSTRLNQPTEGAVVVIMQRLHESDLTGHLLDRGGWEHLCIPARYEPDHPHVYAGDRRTEGGELLWPERFPEEEVRRLETDLGSYGAAGQLQQRPAPREGGLFDREWFEVVEAAPAGGRDVRGWDLAGTKRKKSPWTVGLLMRLVRDEFYILDVVRIRGTPEEVESTIKNTASQDGPGVTIDLPQDPGQSGLSQARYLVRQLAGYNVRYSPESGDKPTRALGLSAQAQAGNVKLVKGAWNKTFLDEAVLFPNSDYLDQIDGGSRAFHRLVLMRTTISPAAAPQVIESSA